MESVRIRCCFRLDLLLRPGGDEREGEEKVASLNHIILPFIFAFFIFFTLLCSKRLKFDRYLFFKIPLPPFTKFHKTLIEIKD